MMFFFAISGNKSNGNKSKEEIRNWEISNTDDGDRFSQQNHNITQNKNEKSFDNYLKKKSERLAAKKAATQKNNDLSKERSII